MLHPECDRKEVDIIEQQFVEMSAHSYLQQYAGYVEADRDLVYFLLECLREVPFTKEEKREQILSALFAQAAFHAHENVYHDEMVSQKEKKTNQLTVLAGDYFSSLYYRLLSKSVHQPILHLFSRTIQTINEMKMELYFYEEGPFEELLDRIRHIETGFVSALTTYYEKKELQQVAEIFFTLRRLLEERKYVAYKKLTSIAYALHWYAEGEKTFTSYHWPPANTKRLLDQAIQTYDELLAEKLQSISSPLKDTYLYERLNEWVGLRKSEKI